MPAALSWHHRSAFLIRAKVRLTGTTTKPAAAGAPDAENDENEPQVNPDLPCPIAIHALLDIGYSGSSLVVMKGQAPVFCRRFALGGWEMSRLVGERYGLDDGQAETLKVSCGLSFRASQSVAEGPAGSETGVALREKTHEQWMQEVGRMIFNTLETQLNEYLLGLTRSLNYAINEYRAPELTGITLCGSAAHTANLDQFFTQQFGTPTEIARHPLLSEIVQDLPGTRAQAGTWTTALGLALTEEGPA